MLDRMLVKLIKIAIAESGVERGCLLIERDLKLEITATIESQTISIVPAIDLGSDAGRELFSLEVINYVSATQANIVIDRTIQNDLFSQDSYILTRQPTSILCTPLIDRGKRVGILYLENLALHYLVCSIDSKLSKQGKQITTVGEENLTMVEERVQFRCR